MLQYNLNQVVEQTYSYTFMIELFYKEPFVNVLLFSLSIELSRPADFQNTKKGA